MLAPLAQSSVFSRRSHVLFEVSCTAGVPDIVFVQFDDKAIADRAARRPLVDHAELRVAMACGCYQGGAAGSWTAHELAAEVHLTAEYLRRSVLPRLEDGGHLEKVGNAWRSTYRFRSLARRIVTIEAKLRDWRSAIAQASRHTSAADAAWVAIDAATKNAALRNPDWFSTYGVGLATVSSDGAVIPVIEPGTSRARVTERELLSERAAELYLAGRVSGPLSHVFGQTLTTTTGADPRLAGVKAS